ncbi:MFS transporter [Gordonia jinhuaensis]|uniref:MFS transporter n=1 Tax=Gordonia jinhuaensis TaxID=1517702 RepID=A0A916T217_9ACTN|nr:MFS transporter [Gordonia jinhuaensis]GGB27428.1 MFS transporter [Gordonia jinhuaensis]
MNPTTKTTVWLLFIAWSVDYIDRLVINSALPQIGHDLGIDHGQRGLIVSAFFVAYALAQLPGGLIADKYGALRVAVLALIAWSLFTALAFSLVSMLIIRILFGFAEGVFPAAGFKLLSERTTAADRMGATGAVQASNAVGALLAALIAGVALPLIGWRGMFAAIAIIGALTAVLLRWKMPEALTSTQRGSDTALSGITMRTLLRNRAMWMFAIAFFGYDLLVWGSQTWAPSYLNEDRHVGLGTASLLMAFPTILSAVMIAVSGRWSDRLAGRPRPLVIPSMLVAAVLIAVMPLCPNVPTLVICMTVASAVAAIAYMPTFALAMRGLPPEVAGTASSMILLGGMIAGVVAPTLVGVIIDEFSWTAGFVFLAIGPIIAVIATLCAPADANAFRAGFGAAAGSSTDSGSQPPSHDHFTDQTVVDTDVKETR